MKWVQTSNLGMLLLGIWLILTGLLPFVTITFVNMGLLDEVRRNADELVRRDQSDFLVSRDHDGRVLDFQACATPVGPGWQ